MICVCVREKERNLCLSVSCELDFNFALLHKQTSQLKSVFAMCMIVTAFNVLLFSDSLYMILLSVVIVFLMISCVMVFWAYFDRRFNLVLYPGSPVLGPNFKARTIDGDGRVETFDVNPNNFYTGYLAGLFVVVFLLVF